MFNIKPRSPKITTRVGPCPFTLQYKDIEKGLFNSSSLLLLDADGKAHVWMTAFAK